MVSFALCAVAESQVHAGELHNAVGTVKSIRSLMNEVSLLLSEPVHLSPSAIHEAAELLAELESRTQAIESAMPRRSSSG